MTNWAVMVSGRGSNMAAFLEMRADIRPCLVISSAAQADALVKARRAGIPTWVLPKKINWQEVDRELRQRHVEALFLLGFMRILPPDFVALWQGRIVNLHPSLLPAYPGLQSVERAYSDRAALGATVHEVVTEVDAGPILKQRRCLKEGEISDYSLGAAEFLLHIMEQALVREVATAWKPQQMR